MHIYLLQLTSSLRDVLFPGWTIYTMTAVRRMRERRTEPPRSEIRTFQPVEKIRIALNRFHNYHFIHIFLYLMTILEYIVQITKVN